MVDVDALTKRLRGVQMECTSALNILEWTASNRDTMVYCDPPYPTADTVPYTESVSLDALRDVLAAQSGYCAISGYGNEWDSLGWERTERRVTSALARGRATREALARTEVLWTNFAPKRDLFGA